MKKPKYSVAFERDFTFYMRVLDLMNFDADTEKAKKIIFDENGVDAKHAFYVWDSQGIYLPCCDPELLAKLIKVKGGVNFQIKQYAEDSVSGLLTRIEMRGICIKFKTPYWFREAIDNQTYKHPDYGTFKLIK